MIRILIRIVLLLLLRSLSASAIKDTCDDLYLFRTGNIQRAMPLLLEIIRTKKSDDWIRITHVAEGFYLGAFQFTGIDLVKEKDALEQAVRYYSRAEQLYQIALHYHDVIQPSPCALIFVRPREEAVRRWGSALTWLGREEEARVVYESSKLWADPMCRPIATSTSTNTSTSTSSTSKKQPYVFDIDSSDDDQVRQVRESTLLPLLLTTLRNLTQSSVNVVTTEWMPQSEGRHAGVLKRRLCPLCEHRLEKSWHVIRLWEFQSRQAGCKLNNQFERVCDQIERWMIELPEEAKNLLNVSSGKIMLSLLEPGTTLRSYAGTTSRILRMRCPLHATLTKDSFVRVGGKKVQALNYSCLVYRPECEHFQQVDERVEKNEIALIVDFASSSNFFLDVKERSIGNNSSEL